MEEYSGAENRKSKWTFLEHEGPLFAAPYERLPSEVKFFYDGKEMELSEETEEIATLYASMLKRLEEYTEYRTFQKNFFNDWRKRMNNKEREVIRDLNKCDFESIKRYLETKEKQGDTNEEKYGFCIIDGQKERIQNFKIPRISIFKSRGVNPKTGKLRRRVMPEDIIINCSKDSKMPKAPEGHKWKEVRHDPNVLWLASWTDDITGKRIYTELHPSSKCKQQIDENKYDTARKLGQRIDEIRENYKKDWNSEDTATRQIAVALYFIDELALRVGSDTSKNKAGTSKNEADTSEDEEDTSEDEEDTVGCCTLQVKHILLHDQKDGKECVVEFDFPGKSSMRYYNEKPVDKQVFRNLQCFKKHKQDDAALFDKINSQKINNYLKNMVEGLTAKVFRTYKASLTLQQKLEELTNTDDTIEEKIQSYNKANGEVANLCNHKRSVRKTDSIVMEIEDLERRIESKKLEIAEAQSSSESNDVEKLEDELKQLKKLVKDKKENTEIALTSSKESYIDPRIIVAWCKKHKILIDQIYSKEQMAKFKWAIDNTEEDFVF